MAREQTHAAPKGHTSKSSGSQGSSTKAQGAKGKSPDNPVHVQKFLAGVDYPASKQQLLEKARQEGADKEVMATLEKLPEREYNSPVGVSREIGKVMH